MFGPSTRCRSHHSLCNFVYFHKNCAISTKIYQLTPVAFIAISSIFQFNGGAILQKERVDKSHGEPEAELARAPGKELQENRKRKPQGDRGRNSG
jgi:hypothetical protein